MRVFSFNVVSPIVVRNVGDTNNSPLDKLVCIPAFGGNAELLQTVVLSELSDLCIKLSPLPGKRGDAFDKVQGSTNALSSLSQDPTLQCVDRVPYLLTVGEEIRVRVSFHLDRLEGFPKDIPLRS